MTKKQLELLQFLEKFIRTNGYAPSFVEMMSATGAKSKSNIHRILKALEEHGRIRRLANRSRAIELVKNPKLPVGLSQFSDLALAREAKRRHYRLCNVMRDEHGAKTYIELPAA